MRERERERKCYEGRVHIVTVEDTRKTQFILEN